MEYSLRSIGRPQAVGRFDGYFILAILGVFLVYIVRTIYETGGRQIVLPAPQCLR